MLDKQDRLLKTQDRLQDKRVKQDEQDWLPDKQDRLHTVKTVLLNVDTWVYDAD